VTPDHVIRTKQLPLVLELEMASASDWAKRIEGELATYRREYGEYFQRQCEGRGLERSQLDGDPRIVLVPGLGLIAAGATGKAAGIAADLYEHTIEVIRNAEGVGRYQALPESDIFDMEYWSLEQAKLGKAKPSAMQGQIVFITGAASGIGKATARRFAAAGASLFLVDRDGPELNEVARALACPSMAFDMRDRDRLRAAVETCVHTHGGLDGVISNAGIAPQSPMHECSRELFLESLEINLIAHHELAAAASTVMRLQGNGGFLLFNASKAAFNPGPGFGPYAVAKAGLVALMKQYALEGGAHGVRSNAINADRVQTALLPREVVEERARARGVDVDEYFRNNLLGRIVAPEDVAEAFLNLALAPSTTGAVLTVDGGNIAASPR
jgi:NAD(P)-dependent dehydrogenase (short-subunit alcohol dehydrogenase family)